MDRHWERTGPNLTMEEEAARRAAEQVQAQLPERGLFAGMTWRIAPRPFPLGPELAKEIEGLGRILLAFYKAVNLLYRQSVAGKQPPWVAEWLDQGKPAELLEWQRHPAFKNEIPRVIRPDLLLTEQGLALTELDSVPGGIGLTGWLNQTYAALPGGVAVLGGARGMIDGFASVFGQAKPVHLVVSEESATYLPEMEWLAGELPGARFAVRDTSFTGFSDGEGVYRFFELFDLPNVANGRQIVQMALEKRLLLTPPLKPIFEEKMLFALLWNRHLREFWRQSLGEAFFARMLRLTPQSWLIDPAPLPPQGAFPDLGLVDWGELKTMSQKERDLILKISGFDQTAWGARGVALGSDMAIADWSEAVDRAISGYGKNPYVLQRYHKPRTIPSEYVDLNSGKIVPMPARVRLCPYYFVSGEGDASKAALGGALATICPAEKKIIHGMKDAVLAPCSAEAA